MHLSDKLDCGRSVNDAHINAYYYFMYYGIVHHARGVRKTNYLDARDAKNYKTQARGGRPPLIVATLH